MPSVQCVCTSGQGPAGLAANHPGRARVLCFKLLRVAGSACLFLRRMHSSHTGTLGTIPGSKVGFLANFPHIWICPETCTQRIRGTALPLGRRGPLLPVMSRDEAGAPSWSGEAVGQCREVWDVVVSSWPCCLALVVYAYLSYLESWSKPPRHRSASMCKTSDTSAPGGTTGEVACVQKLTAGRVRPASLEGGTFHRGHGNLLQHPVFPLVLPS